MKSTNNQLPRGKELPLSLRRYLNKIKILERDFSHFTCEIKILFVPLQSQSPDGGIGRRAGLKHQWGNPSRFDPGSGYVKLFGKCCKSSICNTFYFYCEQKTSKKQHYTPFLCKKGASASLHPHHNQKI